MIRRYFHSILLAAAFVIAVQGLAYAGEAVRVLGGGAKGWAGWTSTGSGWHETTFAREQDPTPKLAHMESSERGIGSFRSPAFTVQGDVIECVLNGWDGGDGEQHASSFVLRLAKDGSVVRQTEPPLGDPFFRVSWYVAELKGREVYFEAADNVSADSFAWMGIASVVEKTKDFPASSSAYRSIPLRTTGTWTILTTTGGSYSAEPYLSSLGQGENGVGTASSPAFTLTTATILLKIRGWDGQTGDAGRNTFQLCDASTGQILRKSEPPGSDEPQWISWDVADLKGRLVRVRLVDGNSDDSFAWMGIDEIDAGSDYHVRFSDQAALVAWDVRQVQDYCEVGGVPFTASPSSVVPENASAEINIGCRAKRLFLLGMTTSLDQGEDTWSTPGVYTRRFFIGDNVGSIQITYTNGMVDSYPLVIGESVWWGRLFTSFPEPFKSDAKAAKVLRESLRLYPARPTPDGRYMAIIKPRASVMKSIQIVDSKAKAGVPVILGLTVETDDNVPNGIALAHNKLSSDMAAFEAGSCLRLSGTGEKAAAQRLARLRNVLYTTHANFPKRVDVVVPKGYKGPEFRFEGDNYAQVLTNILYANLDDISKRVDAEGVYHTSAKGAASWGIYRGFGTYRDGFNSYYHTSWTRDMGRSLGELCAFGYLDEAKRCADYVFQKAQVWEQDPELKLNGITLPRHICRVLQHPKTEPGQGCFENDGHGLTALFVYNLWRRLPDRDQWLRTRWEDVQGLGDWVLWQFEHPDVSGATNVLRTDSECAGGTGNSVYADMACLEALDGLADMADSIGQTQKASEWRERARLMRAGCERAYITATKIYGPTWTLAHSGWPDRSTVMGPIILPSDRTGFLGSGKDPWKAYNEAAYQRQITRHKPFGYFGVAMGYGQGFVTQSALLLDRMHDATTMLHWAAKETYCSAFNPYIVPEGCEIDPTGQYWHRTGDLGNGVQQAEIVKALRLVIGVDDSSPKVLHLCPRMPLGWTTISVRRVPAMVQRSGEIRMAHISYTLRRGSTPDAMNMSLSSDRPLPGVVVRVGPLKTKAKIAHVSVDGKHWTAKVQQSGDSGWVTVALPGGKTTATIAVAK